MLKMTLYTGLLLAQIASADQITLKNGDRLSGAILKNDGKLLTMKSEFAGTVTVPWEAVTGLSSPGPLHVGLNDGQVVVGAVTMSAENGRLSIVTKETGTVAASRESVQSIRSSEEQAAYNTEIDRYRNPRLVDLWAGFFDAGFATSQGNARTVALTLGGSANRATSRDKIGVHYTSLYASSNASGRTITTANAKRGGISYNLNLDKKWFTFGSVDLESDQFQNLDLRFVPAGGLGNHLIRTEHTILDLQLGAAANREFFSTGLNRTSGELLLGQELVKKFTATTSLNERLFFYNNLTDGGNYRINFDVSAVTAVRRWLSWQLTASNRYLSNPVPGRKTNDILFTTGLRITFAK
jgi:putative salt-induced outer membrane protein YdiY